MITIITTNMDATTPPAIPPPLTDESLVGTSVGDDSVIKPVQLDYKTVLTLQHSV